MFVIIIFLITHSCLLFHNKRRDVLFVAISQECGRILSSRMLISSGDFCSFPPRKDGEAIKDCS